MHERDDSGLGLTELMVAMLLLMIIMMALISSVVLALKATAANATSATAAEAVQQRLEDVRAASVSGDCDVIEAAALPTTTVRDGRGVTLSIVGAIDGSTLGAACVEAASSADRDPVQVLTVTVSATSALPGAKNPVAQTTTDVLVKFVP